MLLGRQPRGRQYSNTLYEGCGIDRLPEMIVESSPKRSLVVDTRGEPCQGDREGTSTMPLVAVPNDSNQRVAVLWGHTDVADENVWRTFVIGSAGFPYGPGDAHIGARP